MFAKLILITRPLVALTALALFVDLFFPWRKAPVHSQYLDESGGASALEGWGLTVLPLLVILIFVDLFAGRPRLSLGLAVGVLAGTLTEFFTGAAGVVAIGGVVQAATEQTQWPAYAGVALAGGLLLATVPRLFERPPVALPMPPLPASFTGRLLRGEPATPDR